MALLVVFPFQPLLGSVPMRLVLWMDLCRRFQNIRFPNYSVQITNDIKITQEVISEVQKLPLV